MLDSGFGDSDVEMICFKFGPEELIFVFSLCAFKFLKLGLQGCRVVPTRLTCRLMLSHDLESLILGLRLCDVLNCGWGLALRGLSFQAYAPQS